MTKQNNKNLLIIKAVIYFSVLLLIFSSCQKLSLNPILKIKSDSVYVQNNAVYAVSICSFSKSSNSTLLDLLILKVTVS